MSHPTSWTNELRLAPDGPPWLTMGLSRVDESQWLLRDEQFDDYIALKAELLETRHDDVFQALPGTEAASEEILECVTRAIRGSDARESSMTHPLETAAVLVQEDLCVLQDGVLVAACVCFPSHWRLAEKIGEPTAALHGPVHGYDRELAAKVDTFIDRLA